ncbi:putative 2-nitropropane dioxygenase family oxidoreductase [Bisporella sp. PMI_857]|nr:putative 2-nitropropane dioxygenase family oxidoreductase [Bisporella sp. PMI_857]
MTSSTLNTWFPGTTAPFLCNAPMLGHTDAKVAVAVTKAGGFGYIGGGVDFSAGSAHSTRLSAELSLARDLLNLSDPKSTLPIGIGLITAVPEKLNILDGVVPLVREHRPAAVWLFAPPHRDCHAQIIPQLKSAGQEWGLKVFIQVGTVQAAREAIQDGCDVLVIQSIDAGGHQWAQGASLITLLPEVVDMLADEFGDSEVQVLAAGGVMDGRGIAAALVLGAHGVVMGTRIVATEEAPASAHTKDVLVRVRDGGQSTVKSTVFDDVRGTAIWPEVYDGRAIISETYKDYRLGLSEKENIDKYQMALASGDHSREIVWAGSGVGLITSVLPISEVVKTSQDQARKLLQNALV